LLDANHVKAEAHQLGGNIFRRGDVRKVAYHRLYGFFGFREKGEIGQVFAVEVGFHGLEIRHASRDNLGSVSCGTELKVTTYHTFQLFWQLD
jgi:hypothetical protein